MLPRGEPSPAARRRALAAARAYHRGAARVVIASGGRRWYGVSEAETLARELVLLSVPTSAVLLELASLSTCENARAVRDLCAPRGLSRVGVVTCDWHLPRALACFRAAGFEATGFAAPSPRPALLRRAQRRVRERVSFVLDRWATWGWSAP
jgi:uncharacterized SAM-binding protein YcdF (DUF218 family)